MRLDFDDALPISARRDEIAEAIRDHQVVVVAGETGSGKTTQLPKIALGLGREKIAHTQPRRIAARSVAKRIAEECAVELGAEVGYAVRFDDQSSAETQVRLVTDGLLLQEIHHDRDLRRYDTIIVDEAHERSLSIDFLLGYLRQLLPRRPDLKVVITSATIDVERFAELFDAPVIEVSGRTYPVELRYRPLSDPDAGDLLDAIAAAVEELPRDGDILVFLPGERDIRDVDEHLSGRKYRNTQILPLFGRLSAADQQKIFAAHTGRRIVLSTNVAETSLTVPGIRYVIDPGLARISRYSQRLKVQRLPIEPISQASAAQRAGRCGRVADGICIRLYAEADFEGRPEFTDPEIQRTNLASVLMQMASLDLGPIEEFGFLDPPDSRSVTDGVALLRELGAIVDAPGTGTAGALRLTRLGRTMARMPVDPRLARMIVAADRLGCLADVLVIVAAMSIQDPRERPLEKQQAADEKHARFRQPDSDFLSWLSLWSYLREQRDAMSHSKFRTMCKTEFLHYLRVREWQDVHGQLRRTTRDLGMKPGEAGADPDTVHRALLTGLLSHVGLRETDGKEYAGARGARFMVFPGSGLAKKPPAWVMAAELVETTRLWARTAARVQPEWIEEAASHLVKRQYAEPHWSTRRGAAMARERVLLYGLPVVADRLVPLSRFDAPLARELFVRHALVQGEWRTHHRFWDRNQKLLAEVDALESRVRRRDLRVDDETLYAFYDERIPADVVSTRHFDGWWKKARREAPDLLDLSMADLVQTEADADAFPTQWFSDGAPMPLTYTFEPGTVDDGVMVDVTLDQLPGLDDTAFGWQVEGHRRDLVEGLVRSLPKSIRREFVPVPQVVGEVLGQLDPARGTVTDELARVLSARGGSVVRADDFAPATLPDHLRVKFRVRDDSGEEVARGHDLEVLREQLRPRLREQLQDATGDLEQSGARTWTFGTVPAEVTAVRQTGYPTVVDEGTSVGLRVLESPAEQRAAGLRGQARLMSFELPSVVPAIGRTLDTRAKLTLQTGPYRDAAEVIEACWLAALDHLVERHGGPVSDEAAFAALTDTGRQEVFDVTQRAVTHVIRAYDRLGDVRPGADEAGEDVRVQLSWLVYPGFVRDMGIERLPRLAVYLQAAALRLQTAGTPPPLLEAQDLEAEFHRRSAQLREWQRLTPEVQKVRWALEELRVSITAQRLGTAHPVSLKRVRTMLDTLPTP
ncbi:MAG: ATP-dependent RNA helicase HrpA [Aeromicrobium sp.]|uniref:ATP-dependent RNA helicase HrpA n=1 Tax=Aeromicrobium sp. TaxID=1871063 RepID=UPI00262B2207|nr:ATP-dependent RNA helicase HrpA [Aeromicrobium sp.]MDF1705151.1 ATP-dependent RNA helicase HrpA [Aeromicrobium sp.]